MYLFTANMCERPLSSLAVWSARRLLREFERKNETCHILVPNELRNAELF